MRASEQILPPSLRGKIPLPWLRVLQSRPILLWNLIVICLLVLYGDFFERPRSIDWVYIACAGFGPFVPYFWYSLFPLRFYRSLVARRYGLFSLNDTDVTANRFVELLKSSVADNFRRRLAMKLSAIFLIPAFVISAAFRNEPLVRLGPDALVRIPLFLVLLLTISRNELVAWAVRELGKIEV